MVTKAPLTALTISRRTALQMAFAAAVAGKIVGMPGFVAAQDASAGTWNWGGNAGHTGELPGPGLDLDSALGELWRIPKEESGSDPYYGEAEVAGYLNGVIYTMSRDSLSARRLKDGKLLWVQSPAKIAATPALADSPQAHVGEMSFYGPVAIDNDILLVPVSNGHLWGLDAKTGELRWNIAWESYDDKYGSVPPTVIDHIAYGKINGGVAAFELADPPKIRWKTVVDGWMLGVAGGYVYVGVGDEVRALTVEDGSEFWRASLGDLGRIRDSYGVAHGGVFLLCSDGDSNLEHLVMVNRNGELAWSVMVGGGSSVYSGWVMSETLTTAQITYGDFRFRALYAESGKPSWELEVNTARWDYTSGRPVLCAGKAYAHIRDRNQGKKLLAIIDPINGEVVGAWDTPAIPLFVADGVMLARDYDTDEIVAIGTVPAVLQSGGRATVTKGATLRGGPSDTAIERAQVTAGTQVDVTGDSETSNGTEWAPVTEHDKGKSGWLPVDVLAGEDGAIRFSAINLYEFGQFTSYPKFTSGTKAEIAEKVDLQGAPSASSAKKSTLEVGTLVTVTSPPTKADEVEWCPIKVDTTGESGWVPVSVLKLAAGA